MRMTKNTTSRLAALVVALMFSVANAEPQSPATVFGFQPGDDYKLASYEQMETYYRQLDTESDRVQLREIGQSALGRSLYLLTISGEENIANLDRYRSISEQLARARRYRNRGSACERGQSRQFITT